MNMGSWLGELLSAETVAFFVVVGLVGLVYIATKLHLESKQNARDHAALRAALDRLADSTDRRFDSTDRRFDSTDHRFDSTDRRFDSTDRKLDQILAHLLKRRSDKDD